MTEPMISVGALFDLYDRVDAGLSNADLSWPITKAVLVWCLDRGHLTPEAAVTRQQFDEMADLCARAQDRLAGLIDRLECLPEVSGPSPQIEVVVQAMHDTEIPAGPQAHSGKPDPKAAGDLNAVADRPEEEAKAPKGGEAHHPGADDPPATPVAGGVAPSPEKKALAPLWTEEEDETATAMKLAGHSAIEIAAALGRPEQGTAFRLSAKLKDRIKAARAAGAARPEADPQPEVARPGSVAEEKLHGGGVIAEPAPAVQPETGVGDVTAAEPAPVAISQPAPPFDPSRPAWWRTANSNLNALGYRKPFSAAADLQLVEDLLKGMRTDVIAADMRISPLDVKNRWRALLSAVGTPEGKLPNLEEQGHLIEILRARAAEKTVRAAE